MINTSRFLNPSAKSLPRVSGPSAAISPPTLGTGNSPSLPRPQLGPRSGFHRPPRRGRPHQHQPTVLGSGKGDMDSQTASKPTDGKEKTGFLTHTLHPLNPAQRDLVPASRQPTGHGSCRQIPSTAPCVHVDSSPWGRGILSMNHEPTVPNFPPSCSTTPAPSPRPPSRSKHSHSMTPIPHASQSHVPDWTPSPGTTEVMHRRGEPARGTLAWGWCWLWTPVPCVGKRVAFGCSLGRLPGWGWGVGGWRCSLT
jgi:hypothetical protein